MARAKRICPKPGCPKPVTKRYCETHEREYEAKRGTREQRGYGHAHRMQRKQWAERMAHSTVTCWRCGEAINPAEPWDLGHDDTDRSITRGPEHANQCNRSAAGKAAHR